MREAETRCGEAESSRPVERGLLGESAGYLQVTLVSFFLLLFRDLTYMIPNVQMYKSRVGPSHLSHFPWPGCSGNLRSDRETHTSW